MAQYTSSTIIKSKEFSLFNEDNHFTDDTVMIVAIANFINNDHGNPSVERYISHLHKWYKKYPNLTYGNSFVKWISKFDKMDYKYNKPYNSYGNGAAMRISPVGDSSSSEAWASYTAKEFTEVSHNHPEGIIGAQAVASLINLAKREKDKKALRKYIETEYGYKLDRTVDKLRATYKYNETCQGTVPEAIICFLESTDFEDAIRNAISIGGDSDTLACITGGIAEAYYQEIPVWIIKETLDRLPDDIKEQISFFILYAMDIQK